LIGGEIEEAVCLSIMSGSVEKTRATFRRKSISLPASQIINDLIAFRADSNMLAVLLEAIFGNTESGVID
jgi:hypothetical protein